MKEMSLKELQTVELGILSEFANICDNENLRYYLSGGTMIGAIRHKGFIPWDDDIDIIMPRPDYDYLLKNCKDRFKTHYRVEENSHDTTSRIFDNRTCVEIDCYSEDETFCAWIDIFPMDGVPENKLLRLFHFYRIRFLKDCILMLTTTPNIKRRNALITLLQYVAAPFRPLLKQIGVKRLDLKVEQVAKKYCFDTSKYVGVIVGGYGLCEINLRKEFEPREKFQFENAIFYGSKGYDTYLRQLYGDYMTPPKQEVSKHTIRAYWRENY